MAKWNLLEVHNDDPVRHPSSWSPELLSPRGSSPPHRCDWGCLSTMHIGFPPPGDAESYRAEVGMTSPIPEYRTTTGLQMQKFHAPCSRQHSSGTTESITQ